MTSGDVPAPRTAGFTLIELLVTLAIIALLLSIAVPRYFGSLQKADEAALHEDLAMMRDALDKRYADKGRYPPSLNDLVTEKYLRKIPPDPVTETAATWVTVPPSDPELGGVADVRSGAKGVGRNGIPYAQW